MVVCGVFLKLKRNLDIFESLVVVAFFMAILKVCTALSANPFVARWYGADVRCVIQFRLVNSLNSLLMKHEPLSDTIVPGRPCVAKILRSFSMV